MTPRMLLDPFAAAAAAHFISSAPLDTTQLQASAPLPSLILSKTETREGLYGSYEVEVGPQQRENAAGTFKSKEATEKGKNKYSAVLGVLLVGSFIIPMVQYWWYIKDDDVDY
ncbi:unnamed protein product [Phaeothamnion confervicola]